VALFTERLGSDVINSTARMDTKNRSSIAVGRIACKEEG
jgi:hypothetical protein